MSAKIDIQWNKLMHLEGTLVMYRVYSAEMLEKLIKTVHTLHNIQSLYGSLFAGKVTEAYEYYSRMHGDCGTQHYAINSMLYLRTIKDKYIEMYNEFISQLHSYAKAIRILAKGYLSILLITPLKLQEILSSVKETLTITNPDYDTVIKITFVLWYEISNFQYRQVKKFNHSVSNICAIIHTTTINFISTGNGTSANHRQKHWGRFLYETSITKPYIALNTETYINIRQQELATCKKIGYEFYCEKLFVVRHKFRYSC